MRRRLTWALGVVLFAIVAAGLGWFFGRQSVSPQEAAAQADAPDASLITVPVVSKELVSQLVVRGTAEPAGRTELIVPPSDSVLPIVTAIPVDAGSEIAGTDAIIEIAERPVFALSGSLPAFRPLRIGARGDDVAQLEAGLNEAGYDVGSPDDVLDAVTADVVVAMYQAAGYDPPADVEGMVLPLSEYVFVAELPRVVDLVLVERGELAAGPVMRVATQELEIASLIAAADRSLVEVGASAEINLDDLDLVIPAIVSSVDDRPVEGSGGNYGIVIRPVDQGRSDELVGAIGRVVIPIESSNGVVLVVPVAALSAGPDGAARVEVADDKGATRLVGVLTGLTAGGEVEVQPVNAGELAEGDRVVVGQ